MKNVVFVICRLLVIPCKPNPGKNEMVAISADSLTTCIEQYTGKKGCEKESSSMYVPLTEKNNI